MTLIGTVADRNLWSPYQPSIQKLVSSVSSDAIANLAEETTRTDAYTDSVPEVKLAVDALRVECSPNLIDQDLLGEALQKSSIRTLAREHKYSETVSHLSLCDILCDDKWCTQVSSITGIALRPTTHVSPLVLSKRLVH